MSWALWLVSFLLFFAAVVGLGMADDFNNDHLAKVAMAVLAAAVVFAALALLL